MMAKGKPPRVDRLAARAPDETVVLVSAENGRLLRHMNDPRSDAQKAMWERAKTMKRGREARGWSQEALAAWLRCKPADIQRWEAFAENIPHWHWGRLCNLFEKHSARSD